MANFEDHSLTGHGHDFKTIIIDLYEIGGEEGSGFHVFNTTPNHYHRTEVLQRTGAIDVSCKLEKVVHGALSPDSDRYASLIVMQWFMQPKSSRRISEATIKLLFEPSSAEGDIEVEEISFHDTYSIMPTHQEETLNKGLKATVGIQQFANLNFTTKWNKSTISTLSNAITLSGAMRVIDNRPPNRIATWSLSENPSQPLGIPASLKVAVLVSRQDQEKFMCRVDFTCRADLRTALQGCFKKIPKDDPIILQPDPRDKGAGLNKGVTYGNDELGSVSLNDHCSVTFRRVLPSGEEA
ncbi:hypothetical protein Trisim1_006134 [Trichoderma cf. simile WF8]